MAVNLTRIERQILANQNKILSLLDEENRSEYELNIEILESGFEREYSSVVNVYSDDEVKTHAICEETVTILNMFRKVENSIANLSPEDKDELDLDKIKFEGFDANNDPHYFYAKFMIEKQGKWDEHKKAYLNSQSAMTIIKYRKMLNAMNERLHETISDLDKDDLQHIINMT